ncbi:MAG: DUF1926 domain-containing protein [Campylobacterales bacterium]|nr:DUF1926 domain-containing protein [Campylobacterales bacterium]
MNTFLFGIHCHQPVDNFDDAVRESIERAYLPLFQTLSRFEDFRFSVHFSGWLLEKIASEVPELFSLMETMSRRKQIEWLGGGYYEPILASIPSADRRGQLNKLSDLIERLFSQRPRGVWLTERVWSDEIIPDLAACGIEYTLVDDYHFWRAGFESEACEGYYISECGGETIKLFPISKALRYKLPFSPHQEAVEAIASMRTAVCFDDGEKFGLWPHTHEWVYEKGWLESFVSAVMGTHRIQTTQFSTYIDLYPALGLAYLPNTSYYEMGNWSYGPKRSAMSEEAKNILAGRFGERYAQSLLGGGTWKNFLVKYPEANHIHKRMIMLSQSMKAMDSDAYREWVYKAQTNDVLWHGVFGGLYLPNLRDNAYRYLIEAQAMLCRADGYGIRIGDIDKDGYDEIVLCNPSLYLVLNTREGGMIVELDRMEQKFNLQNTLSRRQELYHGATADQGQNDQEGEGIRTIHQPHAPLSPEAEEALQFDFYRRGSFVDHFCESDITPAQLKRCDYQEHGDFAVSPFWVMEEGGNWVILKRSGSVAGSAVSLQKNYRAESDALYVSLSIEHATRPDLLYLCEMNLHFANLNDVVIRADGEIVQEREITLYALRRLTIADPYLNETMQIEWNRECTVFLHPVSTVSQSEQGIELSVQGLMIAFAFAYEPPMHLDASIRWSKGVL